MGQEWEGAGMQMLRSDGRLTASARRHEEERKAKKSSVPQTIPQSFRVASAPPSSHSAPGRIFEGLRCCVLSGLDKMKHSKAKLETMLKDGGAYVSALPTANTQYIFVGQRTARLAAYLPAENEESEVTSSRKRTNTKKPVKEKSAKKWEGDILTCQWIVDSAEQGHQQPMVKRYWISVTDALKNREMKSMDVYGDTYDVDIASSDLRELMQSMDLTALEDNLSDVIGNVGSGKRSRCPSRWGIIEHVENELVPNSYPLHVLASLRPCKIYVFDPHVHMEQNHGSDVSAHVAVLQAMVSFYGGRVVSGTDISDISHIVIPQECCQDVNLRPHILNWCRSVDPRTFVIDHRWLDQCIAERTLLDERGYLVK